MIGTLLGQMVSRQALQVSQDQCYETIQGGTIATLPGAEECGDPACGNLVQHLFGYAVATVMLRTSRKRF